jgi:signal transduction histidine kinase
MSLKWKLALATSGLLLAAVAAFSAVLLWTGRRELAAAQDRRQRAAAAGLAEVCRSAIVNQQDLPLTNYLRRLASDEDVREAYCADAAGRVVGHTDPTRLGTPAAPREGVRAEASVTVGQAPLGAVGIVYDPAALKARLDAAQRQARSQVFRVAVIVGAAGFMLAFLVTALAVRPVGILVEGVRALAEGRLDHQVPLDRKDELGWLAAEFNKMAGRLSDLDRMKSDFVNGVTHDLKSPLTAVKTSADNLDAFLDKPGDPVAARESVAVVRRNADRLMNLITSILEVARIENGLELRKAPVDLESLADRAAGAFRPAAKQKGLVLEVVAESPVPPLSADEGKLERVLSNLVGNAVKFTDKGSVTVRVGKEGGFAYVAVEDTGPGVPPAFRERLFSKFSRADAAAGKEGTGLGLAIAKGILEAHGGGLSAGEAPGGGALFTARVPL